MSDTIIKKLMFYETTIIDGIHWKSVTSFKPAKFSGDITFFVAVGNGSNVMYSSNGIDWLLTNCPNGNWTSITTNTNILVAVASSGTNRVMTSTDGINWTSRDAAAQNEWTSVTHGNGLFVSVASSGTNRVMTSTDGINWTSHHAAAQNEWTSVTYGENYAKFFAVSKTGLGNRAMYSVDGINWSITTTPSPDYEWNSITYCPSRLIKFSTSDNDSFYVAVGNSDYAMICTDGINWTSQNSNGGQIYVSDNITGNNWTCIIAGEGAGDNNYPDGLVALSNKGMNSRYVNASTTTPVDQVLPGQTPTIANFNVSNSSTTNWNCICCENTKFVALSNTIGMVSIDPSTLQKPLLSNLNIPSKVNLKNGIFKINPPSTSNFGLIGNPIFIYSSSNPSIARVDENGKITFVSKGNCVISVTQINSDLRTVTISAPLTVESNKPKPKPKYKVYLINDIPVNWHMKRIIKYNCVGITNPECIMNSYL